MLDVKNILTVTLLISAFGTETATVNVVSGLSDRDLEFMEEVTQEWELKTGITVNFVDLPSSAYDDLFGFYREWLEAGNTDVDVYFTDVIWAPQLANQFVDLTPYVQDVIDDHFPSIIESQTVNGKLVALPAYTEIPALYYRKDLLEKYGKSIPKTWDELTVTAQEIMDKERAAGNPHMFGFVFQGKAYEGLTCDALEWVKSYGGGQIVEPDGTISINNPNAVKALERAKTWVGTIAPETVLSHTEDVSHSIWQSGNAVFMRNWTYGVALGNDDDSAIKGKFDVTTLPSGGGGSVATLGGWNIAVSKYSFNQGAAISFAKFIASTEFQTKRALNTSHLPTIISVYDDPQVKAEQPIIPRWKEVFLNAAQRPSATTKVKYNEVSTLFWNAVHNTLSGDGSAEENLEILEDELEDLRDGPTW